MNKSNNSVDDKLPLCEILDRVLNKGVVLSGEIVISVAGVPLLYLGLNVVLSSVETLLETMENNSLGGICDKLS